MTLRRLSPDVYLAEGPFAAIGPADVAMLAEAVDSSTHGRVRINLHPGGDDPLHDMVIAIRQTSYIRPHKHLGKSETFHVIKGSVDIVIFEDNGDIRAVVSLAAESPDRAFCYRMSDSLFHTLVIHSELLVVHEITNGPFRPEQTVFAPFAPPDSDISGAATYREGLRQRVAERGLA